MVVFSWRHLSWLESPLMMEFFGPSSSTFYFLTIITVSNHLHHHYRHHHYCHHHHWLKSSSSSSLFHIIITINFCLQRNKQKLQNQHDFHQNSQNHHCGHRWSLPITMIQNGLEKLKWGQRPRMSARRIIIAISIITLCIISTIKHRHQQQNMH